MCIGYRIQSRKTIKSKVPLPEFEYMWDQGRETKYFSTTDLRFGDHQVTVESEDISKTAFYIRYEQLEKLVTSNGLDGAL